MESTIELRYLTTERDQLFKARCELSSYLGETLRSLSTLNRQLNELLLQKNTKTNNMISTIENHVYLETVAGLVSFYPSNLALPLTFGFTLGIGASLISKYQEYKQAINEANNQLTMSLEKMLDRKSKLESRKDHLYEVMESLREEEVSDTARIKELEFSKKQGKKEEKSDTSWQIVSQSEDKLQKIKTLLQTEKEAQSKMPKAKMYIR